jgi:hypothetical protein
LVQSYLKSQGFLLVASAPLLVACPTKEAEDPHEILGEWASPPEGETAPATGKKDPRTAAPSAAPATKAECAAAARRIEELALDLAVREEEDPQKRAELMDKKKQELASAAFKVRVARGTDDCIARETSGAEARCIARARSEMDVERCGGR